MKKSWVIPDIHGHYKTLRELIEDKIRPSRNDNLYFLGDYIDRGPDSRRVIDFLMELQADDYSARFIRGNHEDYLLRLYNNEKLKPGFLGIPWRNKLKKEWYKFGGKETLASFGIKDVRDIPEKYIKWLNQLEYFIELENHILVHAGLNFEIDKPFSDTRSMMWVKDFKVIPEKIRNKKVIHGHVPVSLDFIDLTRKSENFDFIDLDNGIYMDGKENFGNLVALELGSMEMLVQHNLDQ